MVEGKPRQDPETIKIKNQIIKNRHKLNWRYSDEETFCDITTRAVEFLRFIEQRQEENILCVAHGDIIRNIIMTMLIGNLYQPEMYEQVRHALYAENTGITLCEYTNEAWKLLTWNDYAHLG